MKPDEITRRLGEIKLVYPKALGNAIGKEETAADLKALTAAIQAVTTLEEIKAAVKGRCKFCKYHATGTTDFPCCDCFYDNDLWEFRWPLGEFHDTETETQKG